MVIPRDQTNPRRGERGSAVLLALVTAIVLSMGVLLVAGMIQSRRAAFDVERRNVTLTALADAAMAESLAELDHDPLYRGFASRSFGGGVISSGVTGIGLFRKRVLVRAEYRGWTTEIEGEVDVRNDRARLIRWGMKTVPAGE